MWDTFWKLKNDRCNIIVLFTFVYCGSHAVSHVMSLCYVAARYSLVASAIMILMHWLFMLLWLREDFKGWGRTENFIMYVADAWLFVWMPFSSKVCINKSVLACAVSIIEYDWLQYILFADSSKSFNL
jgi:hypothetical protein